jgi:hypothetical protein
LKTHRGRIDGVDNGTRDIAAGVALSLPAFPLAAWTIARYYRFLGLRYLCQSLPLIFRRLWELPPLLANNFRDVGISQARVLSHHYSLVMLAV